MRKQKLFIKNFTNIFFKKITRNTKTDFRKINI